MYYLSMRFFILIMSFAESYLRKQKQPSCAMEMVPRSAFEMAVIIPCFNEPEIGLTIQSLYQCKYPDIQVAVIVVVNDADNSCQEIRDQNRRTIEELLETDKSSPKWISLYVLNATGLPLKHAGAGWARKIGMDWAVSAFHKNSCQNGVLVSLDADSLVEPNYLEVISQFYKNNPKAAGATLYFEHPLTDGAQGKAIALYELYMRYYKHALEYAGFPHSIYTIGSCFTVTAKAYTAQGGMNRKKAGEDFYFLHKMVQFAPVGEINNTTVYPSARLSDRVPFGTGPVIRKYLEGNRELERTYPFKAFLVIKDFFANTAKFYSKDNLTENDLSTNKVFVSFLKSTNFIADLNKLKANCASPDTFQKRLFHLFNAFQILKWLNFSLLNGFDKSPLLNETTKLLTDLNVLTEKRHNDPKLMLKLFRDIDKARSFH